MHSFVFQMKQYLEQLKCRENDFKVSCLLGTNRGARAHFSYMVAEMFVECSYSMPKYWLSEDATT
jgi:hypothetical protein